ncbi:hypothetical protein ACH5RR_033985 [Cinchona calisaya]|uniref:Uncharacterized protein n=1 Tax=Cinchona calisaya TaxID=153742 RepID=A0ABD2YDD9_9GENT
MKSKNQSFTVAGVEESDAAVARAEGEDISVAILVCDGGSSSVSIAAPTTAAATFNHKKEKYRAGFVIFSIGAASPSSETMVVQENATKIAIVREDAVVGTAQRNEWVAAIDQELGAIRVKREEAIGVAVTNAITEVDPITANDDITIVLQEKKTAATACADTNTVAASFSHHLVT